MQLQREFRRRHLLPAEAIRRLDAISFNWDPQVWPSMKDALVAPLGRLRLAPLLPQPTCVCVTIAALK